PTGRLQIRGIRAFAPHKGEGRTPGVPDLGPAGACPGGPGKSTAACWGAEASRGRRSHPRPKRIPAPSTARGFDDGTDGGTPAHLWADTRVCACDEVGGRRACGGELPLEYLLNC